MKGILRGNRSGNKGTLLGYLGQTLLETAPSVNIVVSYLTREA